MFRLTLLKRSFAVLVALFCILPCHGGTMLMSFKNIDEPTQRGLLVEWSGSYAFEQEYVLIWGDENTTDHVSISPNAFLNRPGQIMLYNGVLPTSAPQILDSSTWYFSGNQLVRQGFQFGFTNNSLVTSMDYVSDTYFQGSVLIKDIFLEDLGFRINTWEMAFGDNQFIIEVIPEPNTYALILGMIVSLSIVFRRKRPARKCN